MKALLCLILGHRYVARTWGLECSRCLAFDHWKDED